MQLDSLNARTLIAGSTDLLLTGDVAGALERARRAARLDPVRPLLLGLGPSQPSGVAQILMSQSQSPAVIGSQS